MCPPFWVNARHSIGREGIDQIIGLREVRAETMLRTHPERVIEWAVQGMLPKNRLGKAMARKLKVYKGAALPHQAQEPKVLEVR